ncbi:MAG: hypothetical protein M3256_04235 [Actinomycetota bacterium]|nr:hypothetical protein [Actinomycetota bacterium]
MAGWIRFDEESYYGFYEWYLTLAPALRSLIRAWREGVEYDPEGGPGAERFAVFTNGFERLEVFRVKFQVGFQCADIAYGFNRNRATLTFLAYDDHLA